MVASRVGDRAAIRRPGRVVVECPTDGNPPDIRPVIIGEIHFLGRSVLDETEHRFAVAIRDVGDLRPRDASETTLMPVNLVRELMGIRPHAAQRAGVLHTECRGRRPRIEQSGRQPELIVANSLDGAGHDAVGSELAPGIQRQIGQRPRGWNRLVGIARHHPELTLEIEVVPEDLRDSLRDGRDLGIV